MILINLNVVMAQKNVSLNELSERTGISTTNLSVLKRAIRFSTLEAICRALECKPGDIVDISEK